MTAAHGVPRHLRALHTPETPHWRFRTDQMAALRVLAELVDQRDGVIEGHVPPDQVIPDLAGVDKHAALSFLDDELHDALLVLRATGVL